MSASASLALDGPYKQAALASSRSELRPSVP